MAFQLVYTSAAKLLDAGRSGYGTVARSQSLSPLVVSIIERVSQFANLRGLDRSRVVYVHRRIIAGSNRFHVLTRIVDAGADYTGRTNHLAHHLILSLGEVTLAASRGLTPADILRQFPWRDRWQENARFFSADEDISLDSYRTDGINAKRKTWMTLTGNPALARLLAWEDATRTGVLIIPSNTDSLQLLAEALVEFGDLSWTRTFTTSLETTDELAEIEWILTTPSAFPDIQARCSSRVIFDLTAPQSLPSLQVASAPFSAAPLILDPQSQPTPVPFQPSPTRPSKSRAIEPSPQKKSQTSWLVGGLSLAITAGIIVYFISPTSRSKTSPSRPKIESTVNLSPDQKAGVDELKNINLSEKNAIAVVTAGSNWQEWKRFILKSNQTILTLSTIDSSENFPNISNLPTKNESLHLMPWAIDLRDLIDHCSQLQEAVTESAWIKQFDNICQRIENLKAEGSLPSLSGNSEQMEKNLFARLASQRLNQTLKSPQKLEELLSSSDPWQTRKYPERRESIVKEIKSSLPATRSKEQLEALFKIVQSHESFFSSDFKGVVQTFETQREVLRTQEPSPAIRKASANQTLQNAPTHQIIIASLQELQTGIQVPLLRVAIESKIRGENLDLEGLTLSVDGKIREIRKLTWVDPFFSKTWNGQSPEKVFPDGKFAMTEQEISSVTFQFGGKFATILTNHASAIPFESHLHFSFTNLSENGVQISGEILDRITNITPQSERNSLQMFLGSELSANDFQATRSTTGEWTLIRKPKKAPISTLTQEQTARSYQLLKNYGIAADKASSNGLTQQTKKANQEVAKTELSELQKYLSDSLGQTSLNTLLADQGLKWQDLSKQNKSAIESSILTLLKTTHESQIPLPMKDVIQKIKILTVQTQGGRILFKASQAP